MQRGGEAKVGQAIENGILLLPITSRFVPPLFVGVLNAMPDQLSTTRIFG
jgi:hypothetical protein